jgi:hypothetical protein
MSTVLGAWALIRHDRALLLLLTLAANLNILSYVVGEAVRRT